MTSEQQHAFCTLLTSDSFVPGLLTMAHSLAATGTSRRLVVMLTPQVSRFARKKLERDGPDNVVLRVVEPIAGPGNAPVRGGVGGEGDGGGGATAAPCHVKGWINAGYTKLRAWSLVEFSKLVFIDADCVVLSSVDELFSRPGAPVPSAAPDVFPPDKFNAGVMVLCPSLDVFARMMAAAGRGDGGELVSGGAEAEKDAIPSYDGGDTGVGRVYAALCFTCLDRQSSASPLNSTLFTSFSTRSSPTGSSLPRSTVCLLPLMLSGRCIG